MSDDAERVVVEAGLQQLVGRRIEGVRYTEIAYTQPPEPEWPGPGFDSLDFGLALMLDDGATWSVTWAQAGDNEGILAFRGFHEHLELIPRYRAVWDVTDHWRAHGPRDIGAVEPLWSRGGQSDLCLDTLILTATDGREAVITLGQRDRDGGLMISHDNLAVFFSRDAARDAGLVL